MSNGIVTDFEGHTFLNKKRMVYYWLKIDYNNASKYTEKNIYTYYIYKIKEYNSIDVALRLSFPENPNYYNYGKWTNANNIKTINYINKYIGDKLSIIKFKIDNNKVYVICKNTDNTESILHISIINKMFKEAKIQKVHEYWDTHEFDGFAILCPCGCGNYFSTEKEMCEYHNRSYDGYINMKFNGATMLEALLGRKKILCPCGCGNYFTSEAKMCEYHNRSYKAYSSMKCYGATMLEALLGPQKILCPCGCGNYFDTEKEMCEYHNRSYGGYISMKVRGSTMLEALLGPSKILCPCGCGNYFTSEAKMCEYYNRPISMYRNNKHYKNNIEICLGIIPNLTKNNHHPFHTYLTDTLYLEKVFEKDNKIYCECKDNGEDVVLSKEVVENICREYNLNKIREKHKLIPISEEKMIYE